MAVFVDFSYFLLLFVTFVIGGKFYKLLFTGERGKGLLLFVTFFTTCNFHVLLFTRPGGRGFVGYSLCDRGLGCTLILFFFFNFYY